MKKIVIAIDGPAGAGKSTVAQIVAQRLGYIYIDTGAMYRAITWQVIQANLNTQDIVAIGGLAATSQIDLQYTKQGQLIVLANGQDVTAKIRTPEVTAMVAELSQIAAVREALLKLQRNMAGSGGVVMDGRDIASRVLPNADVKIFLTASIEERARRRWVELKAKGYAVDLEDLSKEIAERDKKDYERENSPLVQTKDAILVDTTALTIDETVNEILKICEGKMCRV
ncbi:Cytidylate kinase [Propionispora sp. 2/2-37]|uniref:(d)CMP kinase n=1 Tax=Propionispora sp. 2/2-37 TaxID=1677858 RepID=UPI0006BB7869|nr:(d)CMP kinase [Propionispora sp. 2/2-37]CUH96235.1 Cytidylate kinase [Propionispora sp. 2/2-37]